MQTFEQIRRAALARLAEFSDKFPHGTEVPFRRIGIRQQQLFAEAARLNHEYAGECAIGTLEDGAIDLREITAPVAVPEIITLIRVNELAPDYDGDTLEVGQEVSVVAIDDPDGLFPRATLRNGVLKGYEAELDDVVSVEIFFPSRPEPTASDEDGTREVEIPDPHSELLVLDLAKDLCRKALDLGTDRTAILALLGEEESGFLDAYRDHVRDYAPIRARFARPPQAPRASSR